MTASSRAATAAERWSAERRRSIGWDGLAAIALLLAITSPALAERGPVEAVAAMVDAARERILREENRLGRDERTARAVVREGVIAHANLPLMARYALGRAATEASAAQRARFTEALGAQMARIGGAALHHNAGRALRLVKAAPPQLTLVRHTGDRARVRARLRGGPYDGLAVDLWLHYAERRWRVFDVEVAGLGLLRLIRASVQAALAKHGIEAVTRQLREG